MLEKLLDDWRFLDGLICTGGNCDSRDALDVLGLFGPVERLEGVIYVDTGDPLGTTIWWAEATRLFYFGVVGDEQGSLSQ